MEAILDEVERLANLPVSTLIPAPYTLHPTPRTLHHTPHTPHPTPYTPHPTPYTLNPKPSTCSCPPLRRSPLCTRRFISSSWVLAMLPSVPCEVARYRRQLTAGLGARLSSQLPWTTPHFLLTVLSPMLVAFRPTPVHRTPLPVTECAGLGLTLHPSGRQSGLHPSGRQSG